MAAFNRLSGEEKERIRLKEQERIRLKEQERIRLKEQERIRLEEQERILETFIKVSNTAYSKRDRIGGCIELFGMGVQPPEWCFSEEALGDAYRLIRKPGARTFAGGRSRRRHPKKTMKKNRKRMTRKK